MAERSIKESKEVKYSLAFDIIPDIIVKLEISRLEQQEMELIERLQNTRNLQQLAFEDLEKALATSPSKLSIY